METDCPHEALNRAAWTFRILGTYHLNRNLELSYPWVAVSFLVLLAVGFCAQISLSLIPLVMPFPLPSGSLSAQWYLIVLNQSFIFLRGLTMSEVLKESLNILRSVDLRLATRGIPFVYNNRPPLLTSGYAMALTLFYFVLVLLFPVPNWKLIILEISPFLAFIIRWSLISQFTTLIFYTSSHLNLLNKTLKPNSARTAILLHHHLCKLLEILNSAYGLPTLAVLLINFMELVSSVYNFYFMFVIFGDKHFILLLHDVFLFALRGFEVWHLTSSCVRAAREAGIIRHILFYNFIIITTNISTLPFF
jgi:hypothetical protein